MVVYSLSALCYSEQAISEPFLQELRIWIHVWIHHHSMTTLNFSMPSCKVAFHNPSHWSKCSVAPSMNKGRWALNNAFWNYLLPHFLPLTPDCWELDPHSYIPKQHLRICHRILQKIDHGWGAHWYIDTIRRDHIRNLQHLFLWFRNQNSSWCQKLYYGCQSRIQFWIGICNTIPIIPITEFQFNYIHCTHFCTYSLLLHLAHMFQFL